MESGDSKCRAAIFIFKSDSTVDAAKRAVLKIQSKENVRAEAHEQKSSFLDGLRKWNQQPNINGSNSFLAIYAHMGKFGLSPKASDDPDFDISNAVSWSDLKSALPSRVHTLWLMGCESDLATKAWTPSTAGPVDGILLGTKDSRSWDILFRFFQLEIGMDTIIMYDEMLPKLRLGFPDDANDIEYYRPDPTGAWT